MTINLANLWECVVDAVPDRDAMVTERGRFSYRALDERANRLANHLLAHGVGPGQHVGVMLLNGTEYAEAMLAAFKIRAVPINVNYRYVDDELRYLFDDADLVALVLHHQFGDRVSRVVPDLPDLKTFLVVEDGGEGALPLGTQEYEAALAAAGDTRPDPALRTPDDIYIAYTGGTTGMPKGVMWRQEDIFFASLGGGDPFQTGNFIATVDELASRIPEVGIVALPTPPLMHVSAHWLLFTAFFGGGTVVIPPGGRFEPPAIWDLIAQEKVNMLVVVGDAMARPLLDAYDPEVCDATSLFVIASGGAIMSPTTKDRIAATLPSVILIDGYGASETGVIGTRTNVSGGGPSDGPRFTVNDQTGVLDEDGQQLKPGSDLVGRLARRGHIPLGYYGDEEKTAKTFLVVDGVRWVLPGDMARVEEDGTVVLLGRGSVSINTGGEKVFPEEVESVLKAHPSVLDAVVVGVPDERWGERVVAVVQPVGQAPTLEELQEHCRTKLAGYKVPRGVTIVDQVVRSPAGKADYRWAKSVAT